MDKAEIRHAAVELQLRSDHLCRVWEVFHISYTVAIGSFSASSFIRKSNKKGLNARR